MPKWLKYAVLVVGPIALIVGVVYSTSGPGSTVPSKYLFADVTTGEIVTLKKGTFASFPVKNKEGKRVLFPASKQEDGGYILDQRYRSLLPELINSGAIPKDQVKVDLATFRVTVPAK